MDESEKTPVWSGTRSFRVEESRSLNVDRENKPNWRLNHDNNDDDNDNNNGNNTIESSGRTGLSTRYREVRKRRRDRKKKKKKKKKKKSVRTGSWSRIFALASQVVTSRRKNEIGRNQEGHRGRANAAVAADPKRRESRIRGGIAGSMAPVDSVITCTGRGNPWMLAKPVGHHEFHVFGPLASSSPCPPGGQSVKPVGFPLLPARSSPPTTCRRVWQPAKEEGGQAALKLESNPRPTYRPTDV